MTVTTHTAPSGMTFTTIEPTQVSERKRRPVARKLLQLAEAFEPVSDGTSPQVGAEDAEPERDVDLSVDDLALADDLNDLLAVALISEWSLPVPVSVDALLDLPTADYQAVRRVVAPHVTAMLPDFAPSPDPASPSEP
jgi:hypothetical protein